MSPQRKKWRLLLLPLFTYRTVPSKAAAYRAVVRYRDDYARGRNRIHGLSVEVDERDGAGWQTYERFTFPAAHPEHREDE